jgi:alpha-1,3-rhamnosyl/mannosyltransferase
LLIAYDARSLSPRAHYSGVGVVLSNLLRRLDCRFDMIGLAPQFCSEVPENLRFWKRPIRKLDLLAFEISPRIFPNYDLYWGANHCVPALTKGPSVVTVHDLLLFKIPSDQPWARLIRSRVAFSIRRASRIIAISKTTAGDLLEIFPEVAPKVEVIYNGFNADEAGRYESNTPDGAPYAMMLGAHRPRKNPALAIASVARARELGLTLRLVVTGEIHSEFRHIVDASRDFIKCSGVLPRQEMFRLLARSVAMLFPSRYEGFGLPLLEAMSVGCPVIALDTPINREIGGAAASYLPGSAEDWARELLRLRVDEEWRREQCERQSENLKRFNWDRAADQYNSVFLRYR